MPIFLIASLCALAANATEFSISGTVRDVQSEQGISFASVAIYSLDSTLLTGGISDEAGYFSVRLENEGQYYLEISMIGYGQHHVGQFEVTKSNPHVDIGVIPIEEISLGLEEVVVLGERKAYDFHVDKKVIHVGKLGVPNSAALTEALQLLPSFDVDVSGNISLRGSQNFQVLIDGRLTALSSSEALKQYAVSQIERVEIITNPSAKYSADNTSGVINIILKKGEDLGLSGFLNLGTSKGIAHFQPYNLRSTLTYRRPRYSLTATVNHADERLDWKFDRYQTRMEGPNVFIKGSNHVPWKVGRASLDLDYFISENQTLTAAVRVMQQDYRYNIMQENYFLNFDSLFYSRIQGVRQRLTKAATIHHAIKFDDEHELRTQTTFFNRDIIEAQNFSQGESAVEMASELQRRFTNVHNHNELQFQADYSKTFEDRSLIESGISVVASDRDIQRKEDVIQPNPKSDDAWIDAKVKTYAGYMTYKKKWIGIEAQIGMRTEYHDRLIALQNASSDTYSFSRFTFFPVLHLSKEFNDKQNFGFSYSRRIRRPSMDDLSPYIRNGDNLRSYSGNPDLIPESISSFEMTYRQMFEKATITSEAFFRHTLNPISYADQLIEETGLIATAPVNVDHSNFYGIEPSVSFDISKWWNMNMSATMFRNQIKGDLFGSKINQPYNAWRARFSNRVSISKDLQFNLNGFYNSRVLDFQGIDGAQYWLDMSVKATLLNDLMTLNFNIRDVFGTRRFYSTRRGKEFEQSVEVMFPRQIIGIDLTYTFNNHKKKEYQFDFED